MITMSLWWRCLQCNRVAADLMWTRPSVALGMLTLVAFSVPISSAMFLFCALEIGKTIFSSFGLCLRDNRVSSGLIYLHAWFLLESLLHPVEIKWLSCTWIYKISMLKYLISYIWFHSHWTSPITCFLVLN